MIKIHRQQVYRNWVWLSAYLFSCKSIEERNNCIDKVHIKYWWIVEKNDVYTTITWKTNYSFNLINPHTSIYPDFISWNIQC